MPSNSDGPGYPGNEPSRGDLPPDLDPRRGRPRRASGTGKTGSRAAGSRDASMGSGLPPELDPRGRRHARAATSAGGAVGGTSRSRRAPGRAQSDLLHGAALGTQLIAALLSLLILLGSGWAWAQYRSFTGDIKRLAIPSGQTAAGRKNIDGSDQNILIVGNDDRSTASPAELQALGTTADGGSLNTDTMMLMHVPANGSKATVISFPRDSLVDIPGYGQAKLNSAYVDGVNGSHGDKAAGAALLIKTIENMTGLSIDHFVAVDLLGFYRISNAIGGVTVCLNGPMRPATSVGQEGNGYDSGYEPDGTFVRSYSGINLPAGKSVISGSEALAFVRQRHGLPGGDLDRIKRQQYFLSAVFRKVSSAGTLLNPLKLQNLLKAISSSLTMDSSLDPLKLAQQMQNLQAGNVTFTTIPTNGTTDVNGVGNVVVVNTAAMPDFINALIGNPSADAFKTAKAADPASVTVSVVNDTNSNGLEATNAAALRAAGFKTTLPPATSDVSDKTTIKYPKGMESQAKALQAQVPSAVVTQSADVTGVTLVLGNNGVQVKSLMPATPTTAPATTAAAPSTSTVAGTVTTNAAQVGCIN